MNLCVLHVVYCDQYEICVAYEAARLQVAWQENSCHVFISKLIQYTFCLVFCYQYFENCYGRLGGEQLLCSALLNFSL